MFLKPEQHLTSEERGGNNAKAAERTKAKRPSESQQERPCPQTQRPERPARTPEGPEERMPKGFCQKGDHGNKGAC
eukprot:14106608-Alexandrium_andersonii.AAC.1